MSNWISVKDTLPGDDIPCLLVARTDGDYSVTEPRLHIGRFNRSSGWKFSFSYQEGTKVLYWMYAPKLPEVSE